MKKLFMCWLAGWFWPWTSPTSWSMPGSWLRDKNSRRAIPGVRVLNGGWGIRDRAFALPVVKDDAPYDEEFKR